MLSLRCHWPGWKVSRMAHYRHCNDEDNDSSENDDGYESVIIQTMVVMMSMRMMIMESGKGIYMICDMINVKINLATLKIVETEIVVEH